MMRANPRSQFLVRKKILVALTVIVNQGICLQYQQGIYRQKGIVGGRGLNLERSSMVTARYAKEEKKAEVSSDLKRRLLQEASTPWRGLRNFFYGSFGFSAGVGGLTAVAQLAATLAGRADALPLVKILTNVGVDFGVVALCVAGWRIDARAAADVRTTNEETSSLTADEAAARTDSLLKLRVTLGLEKESRREVSLDTLRSIARQSFVVVGGTRSAIEEALKDALIQQKLFANSECIVVPVSMEDIELIPSKPIYRAGFVALPSPDDATAWTDFVSAEIATAKEQGCDQNALADGIVIAVRQDGTIVRRGVGRPPWKPLLSELDSSSVSMAKTEEEIVSTLT